MKRKYVNFPKLKSPFLYNQYLGSFVVWSQKSEIFNCQKYFEMLSNLIIDGAMKCFQSKKYNITYSKRGGTTYNPTKHACYG